MICNYCMHEFEPSHFNQRLCSSDCKRLAIRRAKQKYKKTEKGIASNERWVSSERWKENEKRYRSTPRRRALAVQIQARYLANHPEAQEKKRERDIVYSRSERGRVVNRAAQANYRKSPNGRLVRRIAKARRRGAAGTFTTIEWQTKVQEYGNKCACCGAIGKLEIDHILPISRGGTNTIDNIQPLCRHCNASKGASCVQV